MTPQESERLDDILSRFWQGESSLEEEAWLKSKAQNGELPDHLADFGAYFEVVAPDSSLDEGFDDEVLSAIGHQKVHRLGLNRRMIPYAAAVAILAIGAWFFIGDNSLKTAEAAQEEEVRKAWEQTRSALKRVGGGLHRAQDHAAAMNRFEPVAITFQQNTQP